MLRRRKWLPPPLRKLSQGKLQDKSPASPNSTTAPASLPASNTLKKTTTDKRVKVCLNYALKNILFAMNSLIFANQ